MSVSLVITVYKDYEALSLVLESVSRQSLIPQQIIVAHDTIDNGIQPIISSNSSNLNICHIDQVDTGFNKNRILNKAILASDHEFLIFVDGDCLLHHRFIEEHRKHLVPGVFTAGRRIDLDAKTSNQVRKFGLHQLGFFRMLRNRTKRVEEAFYIPSPLISSKKSPKLLGCNMGWCKSDLIALNGFDMDYTLPGYGEDTDIEFRALRSGMTPKNMRWKALQYHLHHERPDREIDISASRNLFERKREIGYFYCENGLSNLEQKFPHE
jgi:glycosyltransferase involved in cell wall biosynthesis